MKFCIFGDSVGKGVILSEPGRYEILKPDFGSISGRDITVKNYAMFGCTTQKALSVINRHLGEISQYDKILIELGGNDCDYDWQAISDDPDSEHKCKTPPENFFDTYSALINLVRENGGDPVIMNMPPIDAQRYFNTISKGRKAENILKWLGSVTSIYHWQEMYNLKVVSLANTLKVPLVDIRSAFLKDRSYPSLMCEDGIHPNKKGYELIYKTVLDTVLAPAV